MSLSLRSSRWWRPVTKGIGAVFSGGMMRPEKIGRSLPRRRLIRMRFIKSNPETPGAQREGESNLTDHREAAGGIAAECTRAAGSDFASGVGGMRIPADSTGGRCADSPRLAGRGGALVGAGAIHGRQ